MPSTQGCRSSFRETLCTGASHVAVFKTACCSLGPQVNTDQWAAFPLLQTSIARALITIPVKVEASASMIR